MNIQNGQEKFTPEDCKLVAHNTGDGWYLGVQTKDYEDICSLKWPDSWPETVSTAFLKTAGFEIV